MRGVFLNWFQSYLTQRSQFISTNKINSGILANNHAVPQGPALGPMLFLIYINDLLNNGVKHPDIHHSAYDAKLLYSSTSLKVIYKTVNYDLKNIVHWLRANKIYLNTNKTELAISQSKNIKHMNLRIKGLKIEIANQAKYLGLTQDEKLIFKKHIDSHKKNI